MSTITVVLTVTPQNLPAGKTYGSTAIVVTDNSGAQLPPKTVNGTETPPWTATFTGAAGSALAQAVATALATDGTTLATASGSQPAPSQFPAPTTVSVTVA